MTSHYGCHDRREFVASYPVQSGWYMDGYTRTPRMVSQPTFGKRACQYTKFQLTTTSPANRDDPRCAGCKHKDSTQGAE